MRLGAKIEVKENSDSKVMEDACLKFTNRYSEDGAQQWVKDYTKDLLLWSFHATSAASFHGQMCPQEYGERIAEFNAKRGPAA